QRTPALVLLPVGAGPDLDDVLDLPLQGVAGGVAVEVHAEAGAGHRRAQVEVDDRRRLRAPQGAGAVRRAAAVARPHDAVGQLLAVRVAGVPVRQRRLRAGVALAHGEVLAVGGPAPDPALAAHVLAVGVAVGQLAPGALQVDGQRLHLRVVRAADVDRVG